MRVIRFVINLLPRLFGAYERLCMRIAPGGFHKPGFYLSTLFMAPIGLHFWRKEIPAWYKRIPARFAGYALMILAVRFFFSGPWIFMFLLLLGRPGSVKSLELLTS